MIPTILKRLLAMVPTVVIASFVVFALEQITPGGAAEAAAGPTATPAQVQALKHQMPVTLELTLAALLVALVVGIPLGIMSAARRQSRIDAVVRGGSGLGLAIPEWLLGMFAVDIFALQLGWLPPTGFTPLTENVGANLQGMILPALALGSGAAAIITRQTRGAMIDVMGSPFVRTAWALGLPRSQVYFRFALKNALISVVTVVGLIAGALLGVAILIERVFVIPGMGSMLVDGVSQKDYPVMQGVTAVFIAIVIVINLAVDLSYAVLDPRIRR